MAALTQYTAKATLDWLLGGTTAPASTNTSRWAALAYDVPGSSQGQASEFGTLTGYTRVTAQFAAASTIGQSASNAAGMTFGPFSSAGSAIGVLICDNQTVGSTNYLLFGTFQAAATFGDGDSVVVIPGGLVVVFS
jgi:hypothetical protein